MWYVLCFPRLCMCDCVCVSWYYYRFPKLTTSQQIGWFSFLADSHDYTPLLRGFCGVTNIKTSLKSWQPAPALWWTAIVGHRVEKLALGAWKLKTGKRPWAECNVCTFQQVSCYDLKEKKVYMWQRKLCNALCCIQICKCETLWSYCVNGKHRANEEC